MPCDYRKYPANWHTEIRPRILARAQNRCEQCGIPNGVLIFRSLDMNFWYDPIEDDYFRYPSGERIRGRFEAEMREMPTKVVLTISHTDHDTANNADGNLLALCQRCHLRHDAAYRARNARETRRKRAGQLALL